MFDQRRIVDDHEHPQRDWRDWFAGRQCARLWPIFWRCWRPKQFSQIVEHRCSNLQLIVIHANRDLLF
jgi:hypothetical protein